MLQFEEYLYDRKLRLQHVYSIRLWPDPANIRHGSKACQGQTDALLRDKLAIPGVNIK